MGNGAGRASRSAMRKGVSFPNHGKLEYQGEEFGTSPTAIYTTEEAEAGI
jgi:hypothetical protein